MEQWRNLCWAAIHTGMLGSRGALTTTSHRSRRRWPPWSRPVPPNILADGAKAAVTLRSWLGSEPAWPLRPPPAGPIKTRPPLRERTIRLPRLLVDTWVAVVPAGDISCPEQRYR